MNVWNINIYVEFMMIEQKLDFLSTFVLSVNSHHSVVINTLFSLHIFQEFFE